MIWEFTRGWYLTWFTYQVNWAYVLKECDVQLDVLKQVCYKIRGDWKTMMRYQTVDYELISKCRQIVEYNNWWEDLAQNEHLTIEIACQIDNVPRFWNQYCHHLNLDDLSKLRFENIHSINWQTIADRIMEAERWDLAEEQVCSSIQCSLFWERYFATNKINWHKISGSKAGVLYCPANMLHNLDWTIASQWIPCDMRCLKQYDKWIQFDCLNYTMNGFWSSEFVYQHRDQIDWNKIKGSRLIEELIMDHYEMMACVHVSEKIEHPLWLYIRGYSINCVEEIDLDYVMCHLKMARKRSIEMVGNVFGHVWPEWMVICVGELVPLLQVYSMN